MPSETRTPNATWSWDTALCGVVPPVISPMAPIGEPDGPAIARLVQHIVSGGCSGLFVLGGCGEGAWLTSHQRAAVVRGTVWAAAGRVPVLVGVMLPATGPALEAARQAADEGADALVVGSPYYFRVEAAAQRRHVEAILSAVSLPILLYNIPQATHHVLSPATVDQLAQDIRVLGIKDSAGDFEAFQGFLEIKKRRPAFRVLQGNEHLAAPSLLQGGDGLVPGMGNFAPTLFVALRRAAAKGDAATCAKLQEEITDLCTLHTHGHWLPALKAACAMLGLGDGVPAPPLLPATPEERRAVEAILARHGLLTTKPPVPDRRKE
jgi:dihydrodipicolinate synthase/N-acetylneuraminate lyase